MSESMDWVVASRTIRIMFTGFFFGAVLVFINRQDINIQGIIVSIDAVLMLIATFLDEILKRRSNKLKQ